MKYVTAFLMLVLVTMGAVIMGSLLRDDPAYAKGEPTAMVRQWLAKQSLSLSSNVTEDKIVWTEDYLGHGKWMVSKATVSADYSRTELTFEEWLARTKGWDAARLAEYASDLSPEDQEAFQEQMRTYSSAAPQQSVSMKDQWYFYETSGLVQHIRQ